MNCNCNHEDDRTVCQHKPNCRKLWTTVMVAGVLVVGIGLVAKNRKTLKNNLVDFLSKLRLAQLD